MTAANAELRFEPVSVDFSSRIELHVRGEDHSVDDIGMYGASLHVAGPTGDVTIVDPKTTSNMWPAIAVVPNGTIARPGDQLFLRADGTAPVPNALSIEHILGITGDATTTIASSSDGTLRRVDLDDESHDLAFSGYLGPSAVHTP
jgi:hypothetical protein